MKKTVLFLGLLFLALTGANAQTFTFRGIDKSPMDMAYYPDDYAHDRKFAPAKIGSDKAMVRVVYSRPGKNGRELFGTKLAPYGKAWRAGANEAPEIKFYQDVTFGGKKIKAGNYALLAIPTEKEWTIILSSDLDQWGAYSYNEALDVARVTVPIQKSDSVIENFSIQFAKKDAKTATMYMGWDTVLVAVPIEF
ncbi:DUF2911 domain-containing protein [Larkinella rosea]|uniref:DUF2911 domain-containing protein n=1 Tax=Larkinella rosea TaxID=2025312 RepID=A0A3P1C3C6_9BACT|nr:DUF2911 domain-containing protein [Larkinella rosea]RRB07798.1 DUF2911 domain-containing protein [Larkinella rosea]